MNSVNLLSPLLNYVATATLLFSARRSEAFSPTATAKQWRDHGFRSSQTRLFDSEQTTTLWPMSIEEINSVFPPSSSSLSESFNGNSGFNPNIDFDLEAVELATFQSLLPHCHKQLPRSL
jgi:hypothetical protein